MPIHIALLRAINVGGRNLIPMSELRKFMESLGFANVRTLLQSGNLLFHSKKRPDAALERLLEIETEKQFKLAIDFVVRSAPEWDAVIAENPFVDEADRDPGHLLLMALKHAPEAGAVKDLQAAIKGPETIHAHGKQLYLVYPGGVGTSKLTNTLIERKLGTRGTARNWNTVLKLAALAKE